jgi:hypothetical protein
VGDVGIVDGNVEGFGRINLNEALKCGTFGQDMNFVVSQVIHRQLLVLQLAQMGRNYLFGVDCPLIWRFTKQKLI